VLDGMADRMAGKVSERKDNLEHSFEHLEQTIRSCCSEGPQELPTAELQTFLALSRTIESVTMSLEQRNLTCTNRPVTSEHRDRPSGQG